MSQNGFKGLRDARLIAALVLSGVLVLAAVSMAAAAPGPVGSASGFEDDDGNLVVDSTFDWNGFVTTTWTGTAPYRTSSKTASGWSFVGLEDAQATNSDSAFAGGTKQDDACPTVNTGKAPNKDDLKRIYLASKVVGGHTYLDLAWVRIPQNTTSPSAHIGFEFNQGDSPCPAGSDGLVERTAGDVLIVYDFEGGATDTPVITLRYWVTGPADLCDIASHSPPCWGTSQTLGAGVAEAKVNTSGSVSDGIAPSPPETLGTNEFGEAGIDLTEAGVFGAGTCKSFGTAFGVSRSSGNSGTAQMKDLVGPVDFTLANCGKVITRKVTDPSGDTSTSFGFTTNVSTTPSTTTSPFSLKDGEANPITNVNPGSSLNVTEGNPGSNYVLQTINCSASTVPSGNISTSTATRAVTFSIAAGETLDCTFTNKLQLGAIKITKTTTKGNVGLAGATFSIKPDGGSPIGGSPFTTDSNGEICVDNLPFGDYLVTETAAPTGYKINDTSDHSVTVDNNAKCSDTPYVGETTSFSDTPLSKIEVIFTSLAGTDVTKAQIVCVKGATTIEAVSENGSPDNTPPVYDDTDETFTNLDPGTYTCTVVVDP
jgi:hypothetical protein